MSVTTDIAWCDSTVNPTTGCDGDEAVATQYYGTQSIFCLTPCSEEVARGLGRASVVRPVTPYELEAPAPRPSRGYSPALDSDDEDRCDYDEDDE